MYTKLCITANIKTKCKLEIIAKAIKHIHEGKIKHPHKERKIDRGKL